MTTLRGSDASSRAHRRVPPKLLLVGPLPPPFIGPAVATERLVHSRVINDAFRVALVDMSDPDGQKDIGRLTLHNISQAFGHLWHYLRTLLRVRPDVVYISIARGFWGFLRDVLLIVPARLVGARVAVHLRAGRFDVLHDDGWLGRTIAWIGLRWVRVAIVLGESTRHVFGSYVAADRLMVVPNGIDLDTWPRLPALPRAERSRSTVAVHAGLDASEEDAALALCERADAPADDDTRAGGDFRIVYLANLYRDKGTHVMIAALPAIVERVPGVTVFFAGEWQDAGYRTECLELIDRLGIGNHVTFLGVVSGDAKHELLADADVVVFAPVAPEGAPWVVLEAMASSRPVIATPQGTIAETIVDGETGYLIPPADPAALAARVIELAGDAGLRARFGASGRDRIERHFSEHATHASLVEVLYSALE